MSKNNKTNKQNETISSLMLTDKKLLYLPFLVLLMLPVILVDFACLGKFDFTLSALSNVLLVWLIVCLILCFFTLYTIVLSTGTQILLINKFEHLQTLRERYRLISYVTITEMRSYTYAAAIISTFLGLSYASTGKPISVLSIVLAHVFGLFVVAKPLRQPEFFVSFLSEEYYLLLAKNYYERRQKDIMKQIKEVLK